MKDVTDNYAWLIDQLESYLTDKKQVTEAINHIRNDLQFISNAIQEIQQAINQYNLLPSIPSESGKQYQFLINTLHLKDIFHQKLPDYHQIIKELKSNDLLCKAVFAEMRDSPFFKEVYEIKNYKHQLINLFVLIYRNSLLDMFPYLRTHRAQISSTLEEMACILHKDGLETQLFEATKHWILR